MRSATINSGWFRLGRTTRIDAAFWLNVKATVQERGIDENDDRAVQVVIHELEDKEG